MVLLSHIDLKFMGLNLGVSSVIIFYLISGATQKDLWNRFQSHQFPIKQYYFDRALRIIPTYFAALIFSFLLWNWGVKSSFTQGPPSLFGWISNLIIVPLNFYMFNGLETFTLIPPAWSLAAEIQFYLLVPILFLVSFRQYLLVFITSLIIFLLAQFNEINPDHYGYRLLPGILFVFMLGIWIKDHNVRFEKYLISFWMLSVIYTVYLLIFDRELAFVKEVSLGLTFGLPLLGLLSKATILKNQSILAIIDRQFGAWSYGIFLFHFPMISLVKYLTGDHHFALIFFGSLFIAILTHHLIEKPLWKRFR